MLTMTIIYIYFNFTIGLIIRLSVKVPPTHRQYHRPYPLQYPPTDH